MNFKALLQSRSPEAMTGRNQPTLLSRPRIGRHFFELCNVKGRKTQSSERVCFLHKGTKKK